MIYLYDSTTKVFTYNGQPMPKAYEVITDRTINDEFFVTGKHPLDESQRYKLIQKDKIIKAHTPDGMQPFRIMDVNKRIGYVEFEAWPLLYADLRKKLIKPFTLRVATGQSVLNTFIGNLLLDTPFTFNSNIIDTHDFKVQDETEAEQDPNQLYDALEILKRIVNRWGGELVIDGYDIRMVDRIGKDTDALLYEKKNITDFVDKESIQEIVTRLHGKAEWTEDNPNGGDQITKRIQTTVNSPLINAYSGIVFEQQFTNNDIHTEQELKDWLNLKFNTENIDKPSRSIELDTNIIDATEIALGDTLNLKYLKHDVDMQIRVMRYQYDGFYNRYIKVYVGDFEEHFTGSVQNSITTVETNVKNSVDKTIAHVIINQLGLKIVYSEYEPEGDYSEGDIWFDNKGGMFFWNEESANWIPHPFNNRVDAIGQEVDNVIKQADADRETANQKIEQAVADATAYTNTKAQEFDLQIVNVRSEIDTITQSTNDALTKADAAIEAAGFAKVDAASAIDSAASALTKVNNLSTDVTNVRTDLNGNITTLNQLKTNVDGFQLTLADHTGKISTIENNVNGLQTTVADKADETKVTQLSNQWTQTTNLVNGHTAQISNLGEQINLRVTSGQVTEAILADKTIKDTRNVNNTPAWYNQNYARTSVVEFKTRTVIGVPGSSTYVQLTTKSPWSGSSGGEIVQVAESSDGTYQRSSTGGLAAWGAWEKIIEAGELISQINIQTGNIIIQTGKLYLDTTSTHMTTAYVNDLKAKSLEAVYADIVTLKTKLLTADVITSTMLKSDTALIDKIFATDANVNRLTAKTAFINSVKAVDISADKITTGTLFGNNVTASGINVSTIVGNISNFIQSNWNGLSSTVSITAAGMRGYSSTWGESLYQGGRLDFTITDPNDRSSYSVGLDPYKIQFSNSGWGKTNIRGQSEGLLIRPELTNTGAGLNSSIHLSGNITYLQFNDLGNNGVRGRIEVSANSTRFMSGNIVHFTEYNSPGVYQRTQALAYYTYDSVNTYNNMAIIGNRIQFVNENSNSNIYITPAVNGKLVVGKSSSAVWYNVECLTVTQKSTRRIKDNIIPLANVGLDTVNALTVVEYDLKQNLARGVFEKQIGFIFEESPSIANNEGESIDLGRVGAINTKAIQELSVFKDDHELRLKALEQENKELKAKIQQLESAA